MGHGTIILYSVERESTFYLVFLCVFSGGNSSIPVKSAMLLDLEFQHRSGTCFPSSPTFFFPQCT